MIQAHQITNRPLLALILGTSAIAAQASGDDASSGASAGQAKQIQEVLIAGPVSEGKPAFAGDRWSAGDALAAARLNDALWGVAPGDSLELAGEPETFAWRLAKAEEDGSFALDSGQSKEVAGVWITFYLTSERFAPLVLEIEAHHPVRVWFDRKALTTTGEENLVQDHLEVAPGTHQVVVKMVRDPQVDEPWSCRFALRSENDAEPPPPVRTSTSPERDLDVLDILDMPRATNLSVSDDGSLLALSMSRVRPGTDDDEQWLEIRRTADGGLVASRRGGPAVSRVAWVPQTTAFSFVTSSTKTDVTTLTIWVQDLESGTTRAVAQDIEELASYRWLPDGDGLVLSLGTLPKKNTTGVKRLRGLLDRQAGHRKLTHLYLASAESGDRRRLTAGSSDTDLADISPDGKRLLFTRQIEDPRQRPFSRTELWEIDLTSFVPRKLRDFRWLSSARYDANNRALLIAGGPSEFGDIGRALPAGAPVNEYDTQVYIWQPDSDTATPLTRDFAPSVTDAVWHYPSGDVVMTATDRDRVRLYRARLQATGEVSINVFDVGVDVVESMHVVRKTPIVVVEGSSVWQPQTIASVDLETGASARVHEPGVQEFRHIRRAEIRGFSFTDTTGESVDGRVYFPPDFDPEKLYPALVYYYGGTSPIDRSFGGRYPKEWWAANGYVVYTPNPAGTIGWGQEFSAAHVNDWGQTAGRQILEGTRHFLDAHPFVDPDRVGCLGASYGGFMTMYLLTNSDLFAAAVAHAGISALSSYWGEGYWGYSYSAVATADSFPWNRPDIYVDQSPLFAADRITTPLLMTHGADDPNVPPGESHQLYVALKLLGIPVELLEITGQEHWILDHAKRARWSRSIVAWFDRWLKEEGEWWETLYPEAELGSTSAVESGLSVAGIVSR